MNKQDRVNKGLALEAVATRILRGIPGITVVPHRASAGDRGVDAVVRFAGTEAEVAVQVKGRANTATAWQLVHDASLLGDTPLLLIAQETTGDARAILREHRIAVIDGLGNAHIELPGLLLHLQGDARRTASAPPARLSGKAGVVAQALLLDPEREWRVKDLAERAGTSASLAHRVAARLDREGVTSVEGAGPQRVRRVSNPTTLLDLWAEEEDARPIRRPAHLLARTPEELIEKLAGNLTKRHVEYVLTGAGAASLLAPFVTAVPVLDVWMTARVTPQDVLEAADAEPVDSGQNIVFLQAKHDYPLAFAEKLNGISVANRFRIYADLRGDPRRGAEQAKHLRSEAIGF